MNTKLSLNDIALASYVLNWVCEESVRDLLSDPRCALGGLIITDAQADACNRVAAWLQEPLKTAPLGDILLPHETLEGLKQSI